MPTKRSNTCSTSSFIVPKWANKFPNSWLLKSLDNICLKIVDCPHSTPKVVNTGNYLMARTSDVLTGVFRSEIARKVSEETYRERVRRAEPRVGDIIYSREGTYFGIAAEVPENVKVCLGQRMVLIRPKSETINKTYLRFWLNSPLIQSYIHGRRDGSVAQRLNVSTIRLLPVSFPTLSEQQSIATILGALDDKIELNRQMNHTLEQMAQALFKSWFVDFDPVVAKAAGKKPFGMSDEVAALFPDRFVDSEMGAIPKGWEIKLVKDLIELAYGKALPAKKRLGGDIPVFGSNGQVGWHNKALVKGPCIVIGRKGNAGKICWTPNDFFPIDTTFYVVLIDENIKMIFLYYWLSNLDFESIIGDSAVPGLNRDMAYTFKGIVANRPCIVAFYELAHQWFEMISNNEQEIGLLSTTRDSLLPKLLSGEIRIKNAEKIVSEAI